MQNELAQLAEAQAEMYKVRAADHATYEMNRPEMEKGFEGVKVALETPHG